MNKYNDNYYNLKNFIDKHGLFISLIKDYK